jgi:plasmid stabilization system protein ParE
MARKIEWTVTSIRDRFEIYQFWNEKNKSDTYSKKLDSLFNEVAKLVSKYPQIGTATDLPGLRVKVIKSYKLFYFDDSETIRIIRIWDSRQNPQNLEFSK